MQHLAFIALAAVAVLMIKHALADFYLQTPYQYLNKGIYGHPGGLLHAAIHIALTPLVYLLLAPASLLVAGGIALGALVVHYHIDWLKEQATRRRGLTPQDSCFWHVLGTDQLLHGLTYVAIVGVLIWTAASL